MAESDWTALDDNLDDGSTVGKVTSGAAKPPGGGNFIFAFHSLSTTAGVKGYFTNQIGFAPFPKGGTFRQAMKRGISGGPTGFSGGTFACLQGTVSTAVAYILGLANGNPHHIVLRKGKLSEGIPDTAPAPQGNGVLRRSTAEYQPDTFLQLRLDVLCQDNGDVLLKCWMSDLTAPGAAVASPVWIPIPGMADFTDDNAQMATLSAPLIGGRAGRFFQTADVNRIMIIDEWEAQAQPA